MLAEGTLLDGKYEIRGQLATGGMGEVYLAHRRLLGDEVAVKVIRRTGPDPSVWRERFLRESRACAQLRHPHIVTILDFNIDPQGQPYLVMEYLNGPSLYEELKVRDRFDLDSVQHLLATVGSALYLAHSTGIVHRDLKPQNIVSHRFETGEVVHKVIDFGLVTLKTEIESTRLTQAHEFLGTVAYSAPEQFMEAAPDPKADQYSLGVIVYELLAGVRPDRGRRLHGARGPAHQRDTRAACGSPARSARQDKRGRHARPGQEAWRTMADGDGLCPGVRRCRFDGEADAAAAGVGAAWHVRTRAGHRARALRIRDSRRHAPRAGAPGRDSDVPSRRACRSRGRARAFPP